MKLAHIVNPFKAPETQDVHYQQPLTLESLWVASEFQPELEVENWACFFPEDEDIVPEWMNKLPSLERSTEGKFKVNRKLPYFKEMLDLLYEYSDADYFIQTNIDIIVAPHFYTLIAKLIEEGHECFSINKRIIPDGIRDLPLIWSTIGGPHNGLDCFVFSRPMYPRFVIGDICMGTPWSETTLASSMGHVDSSFIVFRSAHCTFHLGDNRTWLAEDLNDYRLHNVSEFARVLKILSKKDKKVLKHPEIMIFAWKMWNEAHHFGWLDNKHIKYWIDKGYGKDIPEEYRQRLVGYNR